MGIGGAIAVDIWFREGLYHADLGSCCVCGERHAESTSNGEAPAPFVGETKEESQVAAIQVAGATTAG